MSRFTVVIGPALQPGNWETKVTSVSPYILHSTGSLQLVYRTYRVSLPSGVPGLWSFSGAEIGLSRAFPYVQSQS